MAVTIDPRPTYFGDRMVVTGSYAAGDTSIDLSSLLVSIDMATVTPTGATTAILPEAGAGASAVTLNISDVCTVSGTTITVTEGVQGGVGTVGGTFMAIGRRS